MIFPYGDDNPRTQTPYVTYGLLTINVLLFLLTLDAATRDPGTFFRNWGFVPADWTVRTVVSSAFLHVGFFHLAGNMLFLWILGDNVEEKLGHGLYLNLYLAAGAAACFLHLTLHPGGVVPLVGASGAISGVMGMYLVFFPRNDIKIFLLFGFFWKAVRISSLWAIGTWFLGQLVYFLVLGSASSGTAYDAHVGGFLFGVAVALVFDRTGFKRTEIRHPPLDTMRRPDRRELPVRRKQPERKIEVDQVQMRIQQALAAGRGSKAADLYLSLRFSRGGHQLPAELQLAVADVMSALGWHRYAAEAYRLYLDGCRDGRYPDGRGTGHALVGLTTIYALGLADYDEARLYQERARKSDLAEADRKALQEVESKVQEHLSGYVAAGQSLEDRVTVLRQTDDRIDPSRYGKIVQEITHEPLADITRRLAHGRTLVARSLPGGKGRDLARALQRAGLPVLLVDDDRLVGLPEVCFGTEVDLTRKGLSITLTTGDRVEKPWSDLFLVVGAWVAEVREPNVSTPPLEVDPMFLGSRGMSVVRNVPIPERFPSFVRQARRTRESSPILDLFVFGPWSRIRLRSTRFSVQGRKSRPKGFCRHLLRHGTSVAMNEGVYVMSDRGNKRQMTFENQNQLDEYEQWLLQLAEYNRAE